MLKLTLQDSLALFWVFRLFGLQLDSDRDPKGNRREDQADQEGCLRYEILCRESARSRREAILNLMYKMSEMLMLIGNRNHDAAILLQFRFNCSCYHQPNDHAAKFQQFRSICSWYHQPRSTGSSDQRDVFCHISLDPCHFQPVSPHSKKKQRQSK